MNLLDLLIKIGVDSKEAEEKLKDLEGKTSKFGSGVGKAFGKTLSKAGKVAAGAFGAAATAVSVFAKKSVDAYANYEQLEGGVKKLYGNMGQSLEQYAKSTGKSTEEVKKEWIGLERAQNLVLQQADRAYMTAGMSANQYMEMATSFSASLINSLNGDSVKAAKQTDIAMRAISDNFNTFGGDIGMIQGAFQGFAKQNYTMLDNLKLGYGGTKTEMERLIADANEYAKSIGQAGNLSIESFSDIVTAIDLVQQKQGIAGTTMREASTTIAGSFGMLKASWENLLTSFGRGPKETKKALSQVTKSAVTVFKNLVPLLSSILGSIVEVIPELATTLAQELPALIEELLPKLIDASIALVQGLVAALPGILEAIKNVFKGLWDTIYNTLKEKNPAVTDAFDGIASTAKGAFDKIVGFWNDHLKPCFDAIGGFITNTLAPIFQAVFQTMIFPVVQNVFQGIVALWENSLKPMFTGIIDFITGVFSGDWDLAWSGFKQVIEGAWEGIKTIVATAITAVHDVVMNVWNYLKEHSDEIWNGIKDAISNVWEGITTFVSGAAEGLGSIVSNAWEAIKTAASTLWEGIKGAVVEKVQALITDLPALWESIKTTAEEWWGYIQEAAGTWWENVKAAIIEKIQSLIDDAPAKWEALLASAQAWWEIIITSAQTWWENVKKAIIDKIGQLIPGLSLKWGELSTKAQEKWAEIIEKAKEWWENVKKAIVEKIQSLINDSPKKWEEVKTIAEGWWALVVTSAETFWENVKKAITDKIDQLKAKLFLQWGEIWTNALAKWAELKESASEWWGNVKDAVIQKVDDLIGLLPDKWQDIISDAIEKWESTKTAATTFWGKIGTAITDAIDQFKAKIWLKWGEIYTEALDKWEEIKEGIKDKIEDARDKVKGALNAIKDFFAKFIWNIPRPKIPYFYVTGGEAPWGFLGQGSLPSIHIGWWKKAMDTPMLLKDPTIFGISKSGELMGGGEAGDEMILGKDLMIDMMQTAVANQMQAMTNQIDARLSAIYGIMGEYMPDLANRQWVTDTGALVGQLVPAMDTALGQEIIHRERMN